LKVKAVTSSTPNGIALVGDYPGEQEEKMGLPFTGTAGQELTRILKDAGIERTDCHITNVFDARPPANNLDLWCLGAADWRKRYGGGLPIPLKKGKYLRLEHLPALAKLKQELTAWNPSIVVACGATAAWALLGDSRITAIRGTLGESTLVPGVKVLSTFHPSYILRVWRDRAISVADLIKVRKESTFKEILRPSRAITIRPTIADMCEWNAKILNASILSVDIECAHGQVTCIGFAPTKTEAIVVPFVDRGKPNYSYWETAEEECFAMRMVMEWLKCAVPKLFQNGIFDMEYLWKKWGAITCNAMEDTMLRHHSLQPEMLKSLGMMGSLYTNEAPWKLMRKRAQGAIKNESK
tara:strand:- start:7522 stop:8580 length:1059 start_codon:yes stop_codon:yes gene_type:complete